MFFGGDVLPRFLDMGAVEQNLGLKIGVFGTDFEQNFRDLALKLDHFRLFFFRIKGLWNLICLKFLDFQFKIKQIMIVD